MRTAVWSIVVGWLVVLTLGVGWLVWTSLYPLSLETNSPEVARPATVESVVSTAEFNSLKQSVDILSAQVATLSSSPNTPVQKSSRTVSQKVTTTGQSHEFVISLGTAATSNREWTATAAEITLDPAKYAKITRARWEAAGSILGGELAVRLVDVTHGTIYHEAELMFNSSNPIWKQSPNIILAATPAKYRLEIKSSSGEVGQLNDSRLVIETQ